MQRNPRKRNVAATFYLTYIVLFIVPILILTTICYLWVSNIIIRQNKQNCVETLEFVGRAVNDVFDEMDYFAKSLASKPWVMITGMNSNSDRAYYDTRQSEMVEHIRELDSYMRLNGSLSELCIYFMNRDMILSTGEMADFDWFFTKAYAYSQTDMHEWSQKIRQGPTGGAGLLATQSVDIYTSPKRLLTYYQEVPLYFNHSVYMIAMIDEKSITDILQVARSTEGTSVAVFDGAGEPIAGIGASEEFLANQSRVIKGFAPDYALFSAQIMEDGAGFTF